MQARKPTVDLAALGSEEKYSWNTMVVSSIWDMRLSIACAATDAEFQNRIILHDTTLTLHVVARQPHPDPNYAPQTAARLLAVSGRGLTDTSLLGSKSG